MPKAEATAKVTVIVLVEGAKALEGSATFQGMRRASVDDVSLAKAGPVDLHATWDRLHATHMVNEEARLLASEAPE